MYRIKNDIATDFTNKIRKKGKKTREEREEKKNVFYNIQYVNIDINIFRALNLILILSQNTFLFLRKIS